MNPPKCSTDVCDEQALFELTDPNPPRMVCATHLAEEVAHVFEASGVAVVDVERAPYSGGAIADLSAMNQ